MKKAPATSRPAAKSPTPYPEVSPAYQLPCRSDPDDQPAPKRCKTDSHTKASHTVRPKNH